MILTFIFSHKKYLQNHYAVVQYLDTNFSELFCYIFIRTEIIKIRLIIEIQKGYSILTRPNS